MVFNWYIKQVVKKKYSVSRKDKEDWVNFTKKINSVYDKDVNLDQKSEPSNKIPKLDLHGNSLDQANKIVKKFINHTRELGYKKILIVTGKGLRSKIHEDPYRSKSMNTLKDAIPDFIKNEESFKKKVEISPASKKDGGEGAFYVYLRK